MFISKKIQWFCLINPYKQLCKSDTRSNNLHHAYSFKHNFSCCICFNMSIKSSKTLPKNIKSKMSSLPLDKSNRSSSHSKEYKNVSPDKQSGVWTVSNDGTVSVDKSSRSKYRGNRRRTKSEESIKSNVEEAKSCECSTVAEQRVDLSNIVPNIFHNFVSTYGFHHLQTSNYNPSLLVNPVYFQYYSQLQQHNYSTNFMCRSDSNTIGTSNNIDAEKDRQRLFEWRTWRRTEYGRKFDKLDKKNRSCTFTVMTFNVLAQDLLSDHRYLYKHHNPSALTWKERWKNIFSEIKQHDADILCLQEVQFTHVETYYNQLKTLGYDGIYKQRTGGKRSDGCAIYYKTATFHLINHTTVEFNQPNTLVLDRDNVAIVAKFAPKQSLKNEFVVATTHLLYNPRREDVRLAQTQVLLTEVDRISYKQKNERDSYHLPIIITGDFNFMPNTPVYKLITKGYLRYDNLTRRSLMSVNSNNTNENVTGKLFLPASLGITDQCQHVELVHQRNNRKVIEELKYVYLYHSERSGDYNNSKKFDGALFSSGVLSHHLAIKSAFEHRRGNDVEATTFQNKWITVDYIFYSGIKDRNGLILEDKLNLLSHYTVPTSQQLQGITIPNMAVGSDHFSLIVKFSLNP